LLDFLGAARLRRRSKLQAAVQLCTLRPLWRIETVSGFEAIVSRRKATADNHNELEMWVEFFAIQSLRLSPWDTNPAACDLSSFQCIYLGCKIYRKSFLPEALHLSPFAATASNSVQWAPHRTAAFQ